MKELIEIQKELKAPKSQYNSFGKYNYRSAEDILEAVKPLCCEKGCLLTLSDEVVPVGSRIYVKATARIRKDDFDVSVTAFAREEEDKKGMDGSQITGTASSYARKYALNGLFCIDDTKDADTDEYKNQQDKTEKKQDKSKQKTKGPTYREKVIAMAGKLGIATSSLAEMYELSSGTTEDRFKEVLMELEEHYAKHGDRK